MRSKASLILMELLVMVLVFALAAAACLRIFTDAQTISQAASRQDRAVILAQNAAEALKAGQEPDVTAVDGLTLTVTALESSIPGLKQAAITVTQDAEILFTLTTGWQEVGG